MTISVSVSTRWKCDFDFTRDSKRNCNIESHTYEHEGQVHASDGEGVLPLRAGAVPLVPQRVKALRLPMCQVEQALQGQETGSPEVGPWIGALRTR